MKLIWKNSKFKVILFLFVTLFWIFLPILIIYAESFLIDYTVSQKNIFNLNPWIEIVVIASLIFSFYVLNLIINYFYYKIYGLQTFFIYKVIVKEIGMQFLKAKNSEIKKYNSNLFIQKSLNEGMQYYGLNYISWLELISNFIVISIIVAFWSFSNYYVLIIFVAFILFIILPSVLLQRKNNFYQEKYVNNFNALLSESENYFENYTKLYFANKTHLLYNHFDNITNETFKMWKQKNNWSFFNDFIKSSVILIIENLVLLLLIYFYIENIFDVSIGIIFLFKYSLEKFKDYILNIFRNIKDIISSRKITKSFNLQLLTDANKIKINEIQNISLKNVSLTIKNKNIFQNLNINFEKGKKYAIIGKSGSGKSSLFKLLTGEITNFEGEIKINGYDINDINNYNLRKKITIFKNESYIFEGSYENNIALTTNNIDNKKIKNSIFLSSIDEKDIENKNATELSVGQKQRLNITRLFYFEKNFLLLDEVLSNIDEENAKKILKNLIKSNVTLILISHHLKPKEQQLFDEVINFDLLKK
ncbi:ATP-binding cassette domain-containing protein [Mesomycoplasma neurolyticum]|uniref:ABC transporter ATP-binding protein n=1 Tax=Mesomycoplasma neurolyticum TaxID=2120 RepID=A0A449A5J8_9BACT|nr:ABC transporter ATP-binding protein [Mesomycoplasma neurolyticum]VEU59560.1 ABC transporter ATP-binding protein [Mesomycoplasma neurolyticum]